VTRGFDPWTREGGAGNTYVMLDQYSGATLYDGTPEDGNVFDQAWDDWSFPVHAGDFGGTTSRIIWVVLGLSPLALGITGHGGFISQPLAIIVIGGLVSSTLLTLVVLPVLYYLVEGAKERRQARREAARPPEPAAV
jgi:hypothetical protein